MASTPDQTATYRQLNEDGSWVERTFYVQGSALMETVAGWPEPRVYAMYDSPDTALAILIRAKQRILDAAHITALEDDKDRSLFTGWRLGVNRGNDV